MIRPSDRRTQGKTQGRNVRSKNQCSVCPAIHTKSRSWLRSSSTREPSDPPLRVVHLVCSIPYSTTRVLGTGLLPWPPRLQFRPTIPRSSSRPFGMLARCLKAEASKVSSKLVCDNGLRVARDDEAFGNPKADVQRRSQVPVFAGAVFFAVHGLLFSPFSLSGRTGPTTIGSPGSTPVTSSSIGQ